MELKATGPSVYVYVTPYPPSTSTSASQRLSCSRSYVGGESDSGVVGDQCDFEKRDAGGAFATRSANMLHVILPNAVQMLGSGSNILFHRGCIQDSSSIAHTLGEKAWAELQHSGVYWFLSCVAPCAGVDSFLRDNFGSVNGAEESMLQYLVERIFKLVPTLTVSVIRWTEGERSEGHGGGKSSCAEEIAGSSLWRHCDQKSEEFTNCFELIRFVKDAVQQQYYQNNGDAKEKSAMVFRFCLVSITFFDSVTQRKSEVVIASVNSCFDVLSAKASISLVAVRSWFSCIASISMICSQAALGDDLVLHLTSWGEAVLPPEIVRFLICRICRRENLRGQDCTSPPPLPRVVHALLEVHTGSLPLLERPKAGECASEAIVRYLLFWSSLGALVVDDEDDNENDAEGVGRSVAAGEACVGPLSDNFLQDVKLRLLLLLTGTAMAPQMMEEWNRATGREEHSTFSGKLLSALEHTQHVTQWARQKRMQRRVQSLIFSGSSCTSSFSASDTSLLVATALGRFGVENQATLWCQRLEWRYYTALMRLLYVCRGGECSIFALRQGKLQGDAKYGETASRELGMGVVEAVQINKDSCRDTFNFFVMAAQVPSLNPPLASSCNQSRLMPCLPFCNIVCSRTLLAPVSDPLPRLSEVETLRRLMVKHSALHSWNSILFSNVQELRCYNLRLAFSIDAFTHEQRGRDCSKRNTLPLFYRSLQGLHQYFYHHLSEGFFVLMLDVVREKSEWLVESVACLWKVAVPTVVTPLAVVRDDYGNLNNSEYSALHNCIGFHQQAVKGSHFSRALKNTAEARGIYSTPMILPKDRSLLHEAAGAPTTAMTTLTTTAPPVPQKQLDLLVGNVLCAHRLRRVGSGSISHKSSYRLLLSTCRSVNFVEKERELGDDVPALSFSEITKESWNWSEPRDLDDYRRLLAYNVYIIGEVGSGKSSFLQNLLHDVSSTMYPSEVEPHTMRVNRTSAIVEVPLPNGPLPLGGCTDFMVPGAKERTVVAGADMSTAPCRVGVNFIEVPTPLLLPASMGHVKLPIRGTIYCILYNMQYDKETLRRSIWEHVVLLQSAVAKISPHVIDALKNDSIAANDLSLQPLCFPVVLIGTHADPNPEVASFSREAAREEISQLNQWFEEKAEEGKLRKETGRSVSQPFLIDSYFTDILKHFIFEGHTGGETTFQACLQKMMRFLHYTAPLSPVHILARWLPRRLCVLSVTHDDGYSSRDISSPDAGNERSILSGTIEGFWESRHLLQRMQNRDGGRSEKIAAAGEEESLEGKNVEADKLPREEMDKEEEKKYCGCSPLPLSPQMLSVWWRRSTDGLLVLFTALQRLRQFVSSSFDEQSLDNAVLYHLGFVHPEDPDEGMDEGRQLLYLRERDVFIEAMLEECRLRGVLLFLPLPTALHVRESCGDTNITPPRMVLVGPEWVESLWAHTLLPRIVVHHTMSLLRHSGKRVVETLQSVLSQSEKQMGVAISATWLASVWPNLEQVFSEITTLVAIDKGDHMRECFRFFLQKGFTSLELLQLLWPPPYRVLAKSEACAAVGLAICGLTSEKQGGEVGPDGWKEGLVYLHIPCASLTPGH